MEFINEINRSSFLVLENKIESEINSYNKAY